MRDLILDEFETLWNDEKEQEFNITISEIVQLTDNELLELYVQFIKNPINNENGRLQEELKRLYGVERPFICGTAGQLSEDGFYDSVLVSSAYGSDNCVMYKRHKDLL